MNKGDGTAHIPEHVRHDVDWIEGFHGSAKNKLPSETDVEIPSVLFQLPALHEKRPRGSKAMLDFAGAGSYGVTLSRHTPLALARLYNSAKRYQGALSSTKIAMSAFLLISSALPPITDIPDRPVDVCY